VAGLVCLRSRWTCRHLGLPFHLFDPGGPVGAVLALDRPDRLDCWPIALADGER